MESEYNNHIHGGGSSSRPLVGFPVGTALLLVVVFSLSGIFSCCYHWDKLRRNFSLLHHSDLEAAAYPSKAHTTNFKQPKNQSMTVIMPGDNVPKFIALPCPCQPPRQGNIVLEVHNSPPQLAVPFY